MGQRGRKSGAELAISDVADGGSVQRPDAPYDLTDEQTAEWWAIVNRMPADWFPRECHALLAQYCRHVVTARRIAQLIQQEENTEWNDSFLETYDRLLKMQDRESRAIASLATKMRLSQQATISKKRQKPLLGERPWGDCSQS